MESYLLEQEYVQSSDGHVHYSNSNRDSVCDSKFPKHGVIILCANFINIWVRRCFACWRFRDCVYGFVTSDNIKVAALVGQAVAKV
jgi:hypothetical protein